MRSRGGWPKERRLLRGNSGAPFASQSGQKETRDSMAEIIGFFRALFQLRDRRFRRVLIRSVAYSAVLIVGFGLGAGSRVWRKRGAGWS